MERYATLIEFTIALVIGTVLVAFAGHVTIVEAPTPLRLATLEVVPSLALPPITILDFTPPEATTTKGAPMVKVQGKTKSSGQVTGPLVVAQPATTSAAVEPPTSDPTPYSVAPRLRTALVNIICYMPPTSRVHSISASGVMIDPKGIILTNAHVAQYFLLLDKGADCRVRTGSPATDRYRAALIYISPNWLMANPTLLRESAPKGTGEYDFALLAVTSGLGGTELPAIFPSLPLARQVPITGDRVAIASYGGEFLTYDQVRQALFPTIVFHSITDLFTFTTDTIDVIALGGSPAAQEGSSGGGVADDSAELVATLTTSTVEGETSARSLHAITAPYIRREFESETGEPLDTLLSLPTASSVASFAPQLPSLESLITLP